MKNLFLAILSLLVFAQTAIGQTANPDFKLELVSGGNQTYGGGGMPLPMLFKIKEKSSGNYITSLVSRGLSFEVSSDKAGGIYDFAFTNFNDPCKDGAQTCFKGYYFVPANTGAAYTLKVSVTLKRNGQMVDKAVVSENITGSAPAPTFTLEAVSGGNQTYGGGGIPQPMVVMVKETVGSNSSYVTDLGAKGLSLAVVSSTPGLNDGTFNNLNNPCKNGDKACYGGYYYIPSNTGAAFKMIVGVILKKDEKTLSGVEFSENISKSSYTPAFSLEYASGSDQTYSGGGMPQPMVFRIKENATGKYITDLAAKGLSFKVRSDMDDKGGKYDGAFNNLNDPCKTGDKACYGGYYFVPPIAGKAPYALNVGVFLQKDQQFMDSKFVTENITATPPPAPTNPFDETKWYRFTTEFQGTDKSLDVINDATKDKVQLAKTGNFNGQNWKIKSVGNGFYRLTSQFQGDDKSLDVINDATKDKVQLAKTGDFSGQYWKITPTANGYYRLTSQFLGDDKSLDIINDATKSKVKLVKTGNFSGQNWKITKL